MVKIDSDGYILAAAFVLAAFLFRALFAVAKWSFLLWLAVIALAFAAFTLYFFRDPTRKTPSEPGAAISAADGVVVDVSTVKAEEFPGGQALRIAVFMNVLNVHVNRSPVDGRVIATSHHPGRKLAATNARAEYENEHADTDMETADGPVRIRQIAGLIARRVVTRVAPGIHLARGSRIGLIRFGSRVDVFLPTVYRPSVEKGERVRAGETIIARLHKSGSGGGLKK